jgi:hypothetical protein
VGADFLLCREQVLQYGARLQAAAMAAKQPPPENMLTCLAELFLQARLPCRQAFVFHLGQ